MAALVEECQARKGMANESREIESRGPESNQSSPAGPRQQSAAAARPEAGARPALGIEARAGGGRRPRGDGAPPPQRSHFTTSSRNSSRRSSARRTRSQRRQTMPPSSLQRTGQYTSKTNCCSGKPSAEARSTSRHRQPPPAGNERLQTHGPSPPANSSLALSSVYAPELAFHAAVAAEPLGLRRSSATHSNRRTLGCGRRSSRPRPRCPRSTFRSRRRLRLRPRRPCTSLCDDAAVHAGSPERTVVFAGPAVGPPHSAELRAARDHPTGAAARVRTRPHRLQALARPMAFVVPPAEPPPAPTAETATAASPAGAPTVGTPAAGGTSSPL
jgi:hypothetical protein